MTALAAAAGFCVGAASMGIVVAVLLSYRDRLRRPRLPERPSARGTTDARLDLADQADPNAVFGFRREP